MEHLRKLEPGQTLLCQGILLFTSSKIMLPVTRKLVAAVRLLTKPYGLILTRR